MQSSHQERVIGQSKEKVKNKELKEKERNTAEMKRDILRAHLVQIRAAAKVSKMDAMTAAMVDGQIVALNKSWSARRVKESLDSSPTT